MTTPLTRRVSLALALAGGWVAAGSTLACGLCSTGAPTVHGTHQSASAAVADQVDDADGCRPAGEHACLAFEVPSAGATLFAYPEFQGEPPRHRVTEHFVGRSAGVPVLNSRPGAAKTIYLDFDGHTDTGAWADYAGVSQLVRPPFDLDGDPNSYSTDEQNRIFEVWQRMSEDYAIFDVNVSTVEPPTLGFGLAQRVVFDPDYSWFGPAGGVAFLNSIYADGDVATWVFINGTGGGWPKGMAEAGSHEVGHTVGLLHQSEWDGNTFVGEYSTGDEYDGYSGPDAWAPVMGVGYNLPVVTFHNGPTNQGPTAFQFDLDSVDAAFGRLADDHGATIAAGTPLAIDQSGAFSATGKIERLSDEDAFRFGIAGTGVLVGNVAPIEPGPNLDAAVKLVGPSGVILSVNPDGRTDAPVSAVNLPAGDYAIVVKARGVYGRIGSYELTGMIGDTGPACPDTNGDGAVDGSDLVNLLSRFGQSVSGGASDGDVNGDGAVNGADLVELLSAFGTSC